MTTTASAPRNRPDIGGCLMTDNIFNQLPDATHAEAIETLCDAPGGYVERIVTCGQPTPPGEWYEQATDEWVLLLQGAARLRFEDEPQDRQLKRGDHLWIPAGRRHRVTWAAQDEVTLWLAVHFRPL